MSPVDTTVSFTPASTRQDPERRRALGPVRPLAWRVLTRVKGWLLGGAVVAGVLGLLLSPPVGAAEPDVRQAVLQRTTDGLVFSARLALSPSPAVEEALLKGVPLYFVWQADVLRDRWYWTDKRVASATRVWRLGYQSLTRRWRLSLSNDAAAAHGGAALQYALHQNFDSLAEALASVGQMSSWKLADTPRLDSAGGDRVEWSFRLDLSLLPRPFQIGLANQPEWVIEVQRQLDVPRQVEPAAPAPVAPDAATPVER